MFNRTPNVWKQVPLLRSLIIFISGIILAIFIPNLNWAYICFGLSSLIALVTVIYRPFFIITLWYFSFGALGYCLTTLQTERLASDHIENIDGRFKSKFLVRVISDPIERERSVKLEARVLGLHNENSFELYNGMILLYLEKDSNSNKLRFADTLLLNTRLNQIKEPSNPDEFNYKRYLRFHQITSQSYVKSADWAVFGIGNDLSRDIIDIQRGVIDILSSHDLNEKQLAIASALLVGYKHYLSADQVNAFASAGAMHVLAVSGLHVGIVFLLLNTLLKPLKKKKWTRVLKAFLLLLSLWLYAAITGFSPSVSRAVTMFSFVIISQLMNRQSNIYNALASSALVLLVHNPFYIVEVGFQLSYIAVFGIVYLQPKIYELWEPKYFITNKIWEITAVSLAAQIATFPLGLLYFHQFPNYFLISNLVVIPLATLILIVGIGLVIVSYFTVIANVVATILYYLLYGLDWFVVLVENLPFALTEGIDINIFETYAIYMTVATFILTLSVKSYKWQKYFLFSIVFVMILNMTESISQRRQKEIVFYAVKDEVAVDFINGRDHFFLADSSLTSDENRMRFHIEHHWWKMGLDPPIQKLMSFKKTDRILQFFGQRILFLDQHDEVIDSVESVDVLYIEERVNQEPKLVLEMIKPKLLVLSSKLDWKTNNTWKLIAIETGIKCHSLRDDGALSIAL